MTLLVFGKTGQVALELQRIAPDAIYLARQDADLSNPSACAAAIIKHRPTMVINAAAYTAVDKAEDEEDLAEVINGDAPSAMAKAAAQLGISFVHISTDYVFAGDGALPWQPDGKTGPLGAYGRSKLKGEVNVKAAGGTYAIMRTSWVFSAHGNNFVKTMLRLSETRDALTVVADQYGGPTPAADIAHAALTMAQPLSHNRDASGTFHFAGSPDVTWADFAREIFKQSGRSVSVQDIASKDFPTKAVRPANSRMDCSSTQKTFAISRPDWRHGLNLVLKDLGVVST